MRRRSPWLLVSALLAGCVQNGMAPGPDDVGENPPELQLDRLQVNNDPAQLDARVQYRSKPLFIRMKETPGREVAPPFKSETLRFTEGMRLTLVAEVSPPEVEGHIVQANDIDIDGKTAVVGYNFAGEVFAGAVQVIDFTLPDRPRLISEVLYRDADVTAVQIHGKHVYVGMGSLDPALQTPALLEELLLTTTGLEPTTRWIGLPSWVVTDIQVHANNVIASVGAAHGGVAYVDRSGTQMRMTAFRGEDDVRGIVVPSTTSMAAVCGTSPRMALLGVPGFGVLGGQNIDGYNYPDAKGTIEEQDSICYLGAGDGGFQVRRPDGLLLASLGHEAFSDFRPEEMVTNAVSIHGSLAFVAAGALGVQVVGVAGARSWATGGGPDPDGLQVLGELDLEDGFSCNMVKAKNNVLVVAAGRGGVALVTMQAR